MPAFKPRIPDDVIAAIRRDRAAKKSLAEVAARHGVSMAYVSLLHAGLRRRTKARKRRVN